MKKFCYRFLIILLAFAMLVPTWLTVGTQKAKASAPIVTVNMLITNDQSPELTGTVDDNTATMVVYVGITGYLGVLITGLSSPYTWTLPDDTITPDLLEGVYNITASATNLDGSSIDSTSGELTIDLTAPVVDLIAPVENTQVNGDSIISFTDSELTDPKCSIDNLNYSSCTNGVTKLSNLTNFSTLPEGPFVLYLKDSDVAGNTGNDNMNLIKDTTAPVAPGSLVSVVSAGNVQLSWIAPADPDLAGYNVFRASSPYQKVNTSLVTATNYTDLPGVGVFKYQITAIDLAGNESGASNEIIVDLSQLPAPTNLCAAPGDREVTLTWDAVAGAKSYNIYYKKSSEATFTGPVNVSDTTTKITNLTNGIKYNFIVRSVGDNGVESLDAAIGATPYIKIVLAAAPVVTAEVTPPTTPEVQPTPPIVTPPAEQGQIKGEEAGSEQAAEKINWTPWIILFILIILAGAATGGYFYWFGREEDEEIITKEVVGKSKTPTAKKTTKKAPTKRSKRW